MNVDMVMVRVIEEPSTTASGIHVGMMQKTASRGEIISVGHNAATDERFLLKEGDVVTFPSGSTIGTDVTLEGQAYKLLNSALLFYKEV